MSATITNNAGGIKRSGVTVENEPIIKSDGAGEVMQWQPSDGEADGVYMVEGGSAGDPVRLGIGVAAPTAPLDVASGAMSVIIGADTDAVTRTNSTRKRARLGFPHFTNAEEPIGALYLDSIDANTSNVCIGGGTSTFNAATAIRFYTAENATTTTGTERLNISSTGVVSFPSGTVTIGSLDIGHGLIGDVNSTAVGTDALDATLTGCLYNTAIGSNSLGALAHADADYNTAVGAYSADGLVGASSAGKYNVAVGGHSLGTSVDGNYNTAVGRSALHAGDCANDNTALGYNALYAFTGSNATAVGSGAADVAGSQTNLTAIGKDALGVATSGANNTSVGATSLQTVDGHSNTAACCGLLKQQRRSWLPSGFS